MELIGAMLKEYGPWVLGWIGFIFTGRFILMRYDRDIESRVSLAVALESLTQAIKESIRKG